MENDTLSENVANAYIFGETHTSLGVIRIYYGITLQPIYQRNGTLMYNGHLVPEIDFTYSTVWHIMGIIGIAEFKPTANNYVIIMQVWYQDSQMSPKPALFYIVYVEQCSNPIYVYSGVV